MALLLDHKPDDWSQNRAIEFGRLASVGWRWRMVRRVEEIGPIAATFSLTSGASDEYPDGAYYRPYRGPNGHAD
jgi:hypothetical protein